MSKFRVGPPNAAHFVYWEENDGIYKYRLEYDLSNPGWSIGRVMVSLDGFLPLWWCVLTKVDE